MPYTQEISIIQEEMKLIEAALYNNIDTCVPLLDEVIRYLISSGGKRIRPLLLALTYKAVGATSDKYISLATVIEYLHTATLLHDDIIDGAKYRRNIISANHKYGNDVAVLAGDYLYSRSYIILTDIDNKIIQKKLAQTAVTMSEGELLQLLKTADINITLDEYIQIIRSKTSMLFSVSCEVAARLKDDDSEEFPKIFAEFGDQLGIAFQMSDDLLDYIGDTVKTGKKTGTDLYEKKITIPILILLQKVDTSERETIQKIFSENENEPEEKNIKTINALLKKYHIVNEIEDMIENRVNTAINALKDVPASIYKDTLINLARLLVKRVS